MKARVTSDGIGLVEESTVENTVFSVKSVLLDTSKSRRFFKPGLPYDLEVFLTNVHCCSRQNLSELSVTAVGFCT